MWRYSHCEFFRVRPPLRRCIAEPTRTNLQFSKYAKSYARVGVEFPPADAKGYDFHPRPIDPAPPLGPIPEEEFRNRFYTFCGEDCCHRWHREQMKTWLRGLQGDKEVLKVLPKRITALDMDDGKRELFWG